MLAAAETPVAELAGPKTISKGADMSDAQIGLAVATPIIVGFAGLMYRMGVLQKTGTIAAVICTLVVFAILLMGQ